LPPSNLKNPPCFFASFVVISPIKILNPLFCPKLKREELVFEVIKRDES